MIKFLKKQVIVNKSVTLQSEPQPDPYGAEMIGTRQQLRASQHWQNVFLKHQVVCLAFPLVTESWIFTLYMKQMT